MCPEAVRESVAREARQLYIYIYTYIYIYREREIEIEREGERESANLSRDNLSREIGRSGACVRATDPLFELARMLMSNLCY